MRASAKSATQPSDLRRRLTLFGSIGLVAAAVVFGYATAQPVEARVPVPPPSDELTVVELFTSQSCYSCPPAEAFLGEIAGRPDVIALEFHVDYWDDLVHGAAGKWKDR